MIYKWRAKFKNGEETREERGDGLSEEERKNCQYFYWENEIGHIVGVDLKTGEFNIGNQVLHAGRGDIENLSNRNIPDYRLIYAKRHFFIFGDRPGEDMTGLYLIGFQLTLGGRNIKRILYIYPSGEIIFGGEGN